MASDEKTPAKSGTDVQAELTEDVLRLAKYAMQTNQLPAGIDMAVIQRARSSLADRQPLNDEAADALAGYYRKLEGRFGNVTARTLRATEPETPGKPGTVPARRHMRRLWSWAFIALILVLSSNVAQYHYETNLPAPGDDPEGWAKFFEYLYQVTSYLEPFLYGLLGAVVYILRVTEGRLHGRDYDPAREPEHFNRLVLGTLSGGAIILFIEQIPGDDGPMLQVGAAALGFLAGYSVDFLFETLDRMIRAILPKIGLETIQAGIREKRDRELIRRYRIRLEETDDPAEQKLLSQVLTDMGER